MQLAVLFRQEIIPMERSGQWEPVQCHPEYFAGDFVCEALAPAPQQPRLLDRVREEIRKRHYSRRTEKTYVAWIRKFILFHGKRHPAEMGGREVSRYLSHLAVSGKVSASTQNQALSALLFLYRQVLCMNIEWIEGVVRSIPALPKLKLFSNLGTSGQEGAPDRPPPPAQPMISLVLCTLLSASRGNHE